MKKYLLLIVFIYFSSLYASPVFVSGLDAYARGNWDVAITQFQGAINNAENEEEREVSLYYLIMSFASSNKYTSALKCANTFLFRYPKSSRCPYVMYQRGRLYCLLSFYEKAVKELYLFINTYPESNAVPSAYYWIAESLYLGKHLQEARDVFSHIILNYPSSRKFELAKQRILLVDQIATQQELLTLLRQNQDRALNLKSEYEQNQKKLANMQTDNVNNSSEDGDGTRLLDVERALEEEKSKNVELYDKLLVLEAKNKELIDALALLYKLEKEKIDNEENVRDGEVTEIENDGMDGHITETAGSRDVLLETLRQKAKQLKSMYDEILGEEGDERK